jgi:hypothetical protein
MDLASYIRPIRPLKGFRTLLTCYMTDGRHRYNVGIGQIRSLAITCHALDLQFDRLFNSETIPVHSQRIIDSYTQLLHATLLNLAISIRASLWLEEEYTSRSFPVSDCGLFEKGAPSKDGSFTIKDVCDKLIHAQSIHKPIETGVRGGCFELRGSHHGKPWTFGVGVSIFCEHVLQWLEDIEDRSTR